MLVTLGIRNLAVIERVDVTLSEGFHVLTGETGAGKSMIVDALSLIAGGRGAQELIRSGADKAEVEALFEPAQDHPVWQACEELGIEVDKAEGLIIRREITAAGKSIARVNGQLLNLTMLKQIGEYLINIHGQHEHQSLLRREQHSQLLDSFAGESVAKVKAEYQTVYRRYKALAQEVAEKRASRQEQLQRVDMYRLQWKEINEAKLVAGEEEQLLEQQKKVANAEKLFQSVQVAYDAIYEHQAALSKVDAARHAIDHIVEFDTITLGPLKEQLDSAYYQIEDVAFQLRDYREAIQFSPEEQERMEQRLDVLYGLRKKYGATIEDVIAYGASIEAQLHEIEDFDSLIEVAERELKDLERSVREIGGQLSQLRRAAAETLSQAITEQLAELQMEKAKLVVEVHAKDAWGPQGADDVEMMFSANIGESLKPLVKIASGGELSRVMLALKTIFASLEAIPVLVFDEVDTGVSGRAAQAIAEKLAFIARTCQVFSITHLPQVACMADVHFLIEKSTEAGRTFTHVDAMSPERRTHELARMLGGVTVTDTTLSHAAEMLELAHTKKQQWQ
jgi:DNA repair protein RecN (Recombination protein N)